MTDQGLVSKDLRRRHANEIEKAKTFETHGLGVKDATDYLDTPEGIIYEQRLVESDPISSLSQIRNRAIEQLVSGREIPRIEINSEALYKIIPAGKDVPFYSPFFVRGSAFDDALASGRSLSDYFALPIKSEAPRYDVMEMRPLGPTEIFVHRVAPTTELQGLVTKAGGGEQVLIPNRKLYEQPTYLKSIDDSLALQAERRVGTAIRGVVAGGATVLTAYDAYTTTEQYQALSARGNQFGADALLRRYEGRTAGGFIGSFAAGAAYGLAAGSETGPGAFVTGAVGGVVGAFAGDKIATIVNEHKVNHQTGTDGVMYAYESGQWGRTQHHVQLSGVGPANPYNAPNYTSTTTPAPPEQLNQVDYQRTTAATALALANPAAQNTRHIDLDGTRWHATREGWARQVEIPGVPNSYGIPAVITVDKPADARTSEQLSQIAANRQFNNDHYAGDVSKAYVMDYYGKGWRSNGPLPDVVTKALDLPSEQHITDAVTGHVWNVTSGGRFTREAAIPLDKMVIRETVQADGKEQARLGQLQQSAMQSNAAYGQQLIARKFEAWREAQHPEPADHAVAPASGHAAPAQTSHDRTFLPPSVPAENSMPSKAGPTITPNSSNRDMFDALMTAVQHVDIDAMRSVSQNYLQSNQGQAWLEQGHQLRQQALVQQQATLDAQQQAQASQGSMR